MTYGYSTSSMRVATRCCVAHPPRHPPPPPPPPPPPSPVVVVVRRRVCRRRVAPSQRARGGISPPPTLRHSANHPTLTAVGHRLLMFGGRQGDVTFLNDTWVFDTISVTWTCVRESDDVPPPPFLGAPAHPPLTSPVRPSPRWAHSAVAFGECSDIWEQRAGHLLQRSALVRSSRLQAGRHRPGGATLGSTVVASAAGSAPSHGAVSSSLAAPHHRAIRPLRVRLRRGAHVSLRREYDRDVLLGPMGV